MYRISIGVQNSVQRFIQNNFIIEYGNYRRQSHYTMSKDYKQHAWLHDVIDYYMFFGSSMGAGYKIN